MSKNCIFHIPWQLADVYDVASELRPRKMLQAFKNIGYEVDIVWGWADERKKRIKQIKQNIKNGKKYDFVYSECSTMPTLLTQPHHLPTHPFLDFSFFAYCQKQNIPVGMYFRDVYWNVSEIKQYSKLKAKFARFFHIYDIKKYNKTLSVIFFQNKAIKNFLPWLSNDLPIVQLPPALDLKTFDKQKNEKPTFVFVGDVNPESRYKILPFVKAFSKRDDIKLIINTRKVAWDKNKNYISKYLNENIEICHHDSTTLHKIYEKADFGLLYVKPISYFDFCMPYKMYEYFSYDLPVVTTKSTAMGKMVEKYKLGKALEFNEKILLEFLNDNSNIDDLKEKVANVKEFNTYNTWNDRAKTVTGSLIK